MKARLFIAIGATLLSVAFASAEPLIGQASVIDGDTIDIHGQRIRLWGIDAPESLQLCRNADSDPYRCGQRAALALAGFIERRSVDCVEIGRDRYRRAVAVCSVGGVDIADWLVRNGHALDWPRYSKGAYRAAQDGARTGERGVWAGSFVEPWSYRACNRDGGRPAACSDDER